MVINFGNSVGIVREDGEDFFTKLKMGKVFLCRMNVLKVLLGVKACSSVETRPIFMGFITENSFTNY